MKEDALYSDGVPYQASIYEKTALIQKRIREIENGEGVFPIYEGKPEDIATREILNKDLKGYHVKKTEIRNGKKMIVFYPLKDIVFVD